MKKSDGFCQFNWLKLKKYPCEGIRNEHPVYSGAIKIGAFAFQMKMKKYLIVRF